ncbi:MAG: 3-hydroxyacyl-ACP dehydratase FabZ family protein, partial [Burkholderiaceae bacterium]
MTRLALTAIDPSHPAFAGHFPARPIVPGVVLLDQSLRAIAATFGLEEETMASTICAIGVAKFLSPVGPGEALRLEVEVTCKPGGVSATGSISSASSARVQAPISTTYA